MPYEVGQVIEVKVKGLVQAASVIKINGGRLRVTTTDTTTWVEARDVVSDELTSTTVEGSDDVQSLEDLKAHLGATAGQALAEQKALEAKKASAKVRSDGLKAAALAASADWLADVDGVRSAAAAAAQERKDVIAESIRMAAAASKVALAELDGTGAGELLDREGLARAHGLEGVLNLALDSEARHELLGMDVSDVVAVSRTMPRSEWDRMTYAARVAAVKSGTHRAKAKELELAQLLDRVVGAAAAEDGATADGSAPCRSTARDAAVASDAEAGRAIMKLEPDLRAAASAVLPRGAWGELSPVEKFTFIRRLAAAAVSSDADSAAPVQAWCADLQEIVDLKETTGSDERLDALAFAAIDEDDSGTLTVDELRKACADVEPDKIDALFRWLDVDGDGSISAAEWRTGYARCMQLAAASDEAQAELERRAAASDPRASGPEGAAQAAESAGAEACRHVVNFVLDSSHVLLVEGVPCVTLGHELRAPIAAHPFWGTRAVVDVLRAHGGWERGRVVLDAPLRA